MQIKNLQLMQKISAVITSVALSTTLIGCTNNTETNTNETQTEENYSTQNTKEEASSAVEQAITIMISEAEELNSASEKAKNTDSYKQAKKETKQNFDDLFGFLFQNEEIAGYTANDVKDNTVEFAQDSLEDLDEYIEKYIPEYKEKAKKKLKSVGSWLEDKGTDLAAKAYNKYQELKEKTLKKSQNKHH